MNGVKQLVALNTNRALKPENQQEFYESEYLGQFSDLPKVFIYGIIYAARKETLPLFLTGIVMLSIICILSPILSSLWNLNGVVIAYGLSYACGALFISAWENYRIIYFIKNKT